jgi:single-strand DNA-binding protein
MSTTTTTTTLPAAGTNLAILVGQLSRDVELRTLPSGDEVLGLELTVRPADGPAESVPLAWPRPPVAATRWQAGQPLLVTGRVRRRFFRAAGATQSRTGVVVTSAVPAGRGAAARRAVAKALAAAAIR